MSLNAIIALQKRWAEKKWPGHTGLRAPSLDDNLCIQISPEVRQQFEEGSGGELGRNGKPGKMSSLRSSSALGYNFFAPWIGCDLDPLSRALKVSVTNQTIRFERKFRHGLNSIAPNIDVVLDDDRPRPLAIECKFTEPYGPKTEHPMLDEKYFSGGRKRWSEQGLPICQELALAIGSAVKFKRLNAGQLLKHILGLAWTTKQTPRLVCLWFDSGSDEAAEHRGELEIFSQYINSEIEFMATTYQEVFKRLLDAPEPIPGYFDYLASRYFPLIR